MLNLKRSFIVGLALLVGLFAISSVALAEHEDDGSHPEDTLFSFGYDATNHFLAINIGPNDTSWVCNFEQKGDDERLTATYGDADTDGIIPVTKLEDGPDVWSFKARALLEPGDPAELESGTLDYSSVDAIAGDVCRVNGVIVAGPNGQINHGQFMKAAKSLLGDMQGKGCVNRLLAQSDIGKGNDPSHLTVSEAETLAFVFGGVGTTGDIDFETHDVDCNRGKKDKGTESASASSGHSKGKSGDAPGHNKTP